MKNRVLIYYLIEFVFIIFLNLSFPKGKTQGTIDFSDFGPVLSVFVIVLMSLPIIYTSEENIKIMNRVFFSATIGMMIISYFMFPSNFGGNGGVFLDGKEMLSIVAHKDKLELQDCFKENKADINFLKTIAAKKVFEKELGIKAYKLNIQSISPKSYDENNLSTFEIIFYSDTVYKITDPSVIVTKLKDASIKFSKIINTDTFKLIGKYATLYLINNEDSLLALKNRRMDVSEINKRNDYDAYWAYQYFYYLLKK
jgi:hypothetical protein